jgi:hypothetical protein
VKPGVLVISVLSFAFGAGVWVVFQVLHDSESTDKPAIPVIEAGVSAAEDESDWVAPYLGWGRLRKEAVGHFARAPLFRYGP